MSLSFDSRLVKSNRVINILCIMDIPKFTNIHQNERWIIYMRTGLGKKNKRGGFREYYSGKNIYFGITKEIDIPGIN